MATSEDFYVIAREPGAEHPALPTWACRAANPAALMDEERPVRRIDLPQVPGAYHLLDVCSPQECHQLIALSEGLGYLPDAAVSLPRSVRHNDNVVWIADDKTLSILWRRIASAVSQNLDIYFDKRPLGLNGRFRFYRYDEGDFFKFHSDGAWPGSRVVDGKLVANASPDRYSLASFLIYLNDDFEGGATRFLVNADDPRAPARGTANVQQVDVKTPAGAVLCFPHGTHPLHRVHSSEPIARGTKYIIRTDLLFEL